MAINLRSFATLVSNGVSVAQTQLGAAADFSLGSVNLAFTEAASGAVLWLQYIAYQIFMRTRLSTSQGDDCDSFVNDFGMTRLPGTAATGTVTLSSFNYTQTSATVQVGALVRTVAGVSYAVVQDSTNPNWSASQSAYIRTQGTQSIDVPVQAQTAGSASNAPAESICLLGSAIPGIDTALNKNALTNGFDQETDAALRVRFPLWLSAKATASEAAVESAALSTQNGISVQLLDAQDASGAYTPGYFTVVVNDGSGDPPDSLLSEVYENIQNVKALGVQFAVVRPTEIVINASLTVQVPSGTDVNTTVQNIETAIEADISAQSVGEGYQYSRLSYLAYTKANVQVNGVVNVLLNNGTADIPAASRSVVVPGAITVSVVYS